MPYAYASQPRPSRSKTAFKATTTTNLATTTGDFVVWRRDGFASYQLAVVVDDDTMGINAVVRGADLLDNTPRQLYLLQRLSRPAPHYAHVPVVVEARRHQALQAQHRDRDRRPFCPAQRRDRARASGLSTRPGTGSRLCSTGHGGAGTSPPYPRRRRFPASPRSHEPKAGCCLAVRDAHGWENSRSEFSGRPQSGRVSHERYWIYGRLQR